MHDGDPQEPIDGEIITPADDAAIERREKKAKASSNPNRRENVRTSGQSPEQREEEERKAEPFRRTALVGGLNWRHPGWEPSEQERYMVRVCKFTGYTDEQIASALDMSVETLQKYFPKELKDGRMLMISDLSGRALLRAQQGDATLTMFILKTRSDGKFSERALAVQALTDSVGKDEIDTTKRAELVNRLLDILEPKKTKKKQPAPVGEDSK